MKKSDYQKYLCSREWALLKQQIFDRCGGKCERCFVGNYDATHHLTYERIGHEKLEDLLAVCSECHEFLSGKSDHDPSKKIAELADFAISELVRISPQLDALRYVLKNLGFEMLEVDLHGWLVDASMAVEERFMPALCEHFEKWREAKKECELSEQD